MACRKQTWELCSNQGYSRGTQGVLKGFSIGTGVQEPDQGAVQQPTVSTTLPDLPVHMLARPHARTHTHRLMHNKHALAPSFRHHAHSLACAFQSRLPINARLRSLACEPALPPGLANAQQTNTDRCDLVCSLIRSSSGAERTRAAVAIRWMSLVFGLAALYFVVTGIQFWVTKYSTVPLLCAVRYLRHLTLRCAPALHVANASSWLWAPTFLSHTVARTECDHTA